MKEIRKINEPKLDLINKMAILRHGQVPIPVVVLKGHKKNVEFVTKKEAEILGIYFNILKKGNEIKEGSINIVPFDIESSDDSWLMKPYEVIDVDTIHCFNWKEFIDRLGLDGTTQDLFGDFTMEMESKLETITDQVIADVLYAHYEHCDDNNITEKDIRMIYDAAKVVSKSVVPEKNKPKKNLGDITPLKDKTGDIKTDQETKSNEFLIGSKDKVPSVQNDINALLDIAIKKQESEEVKIEVPEEDPEEETVIPVPKSTTKKKPAIVAKEELTKNEEEQNTKLLANLRELYKTTIRFVNETCNSQYKIIVNKMQDAIDTDIYKQVFTKMYLELSDDTSTELYKKLYDIDIATQKFHKSVTHQIKHLGCFNCGTEWDEDVTFLSKGPHTVRCPKCFNDYPFEK